MALHNFEQDYSKHVGTYTGGGASNQDVSSKEAKKFLEEANEQKSILHPKPMKDSSHG